MPQTLHEQIRLVADSRGEPMAQVIREILTGAISRTQKPTNRGLQTLREISRIGATGGPADLSTNLDHYMYGGAKKTS